MEQVIVYKNSLGGVSLCYPSKDKSIIDTKLKDTPTSSIILKKDNLPKDVDFFDCWEINNGVTVTVNFEKAKEQTRKRLRKERKPLFEIQDIEFQRALEQGLNTEEIVMKKQKLRDLTSLVDQCSTIEELRSLKAGI